MRTGHHSRAGAPASALAALLMALVATAPCRADDADALDVARRFFERPDVPHGEVLPDRDPTMPEAIVFPVREQSSPRHGYIQIEEDEPRVACFTCPRPPWDLGIETPHWDDIVAIARRWVAEFQGDPPPGWRWVFIDTPGQEFYEEWSFAAPVRYVLAKTVAGEEVRVHALGEVRVSPDGRQVPSCHRYEPAARLALDDPPTEADIASLRTAAAEALGLEVTDVAMGPVRAYVLPRGWPDPTAPGVWRVRVESLRSPPRAADLILDEHRPSVEQVVGLSGPPVPPSLTDFAIPEYAEDSAPRWITSYGGWGFLSRRPRIGAPWWKPATGLMVQPEGEAPGCLYPAWARSAEDWRVEGDVAVMTVEGGVLVLHDLRTGAKTSYGDSTSITFSQAALSPDARMLAYVSQRTHGDVDLFIDALDPANLMPGAHRRVLRLDGTEARPAFSPDVQRLWFAHGPPSPRTGDPGPAPWSIGWVPTDAEHGNKEWTELAKGFSDILGLSVFPEGDRLLVETWAAERPEDTPRRRELWIVDASTGERTLLDLGTLRDPDHPGIELFLRDAALGPDGTHLAFAGFLVHEDGSGQAIYECALDGSDLRRVTPLEDHPVDFWTFPESGRSAFELEKERWLEADNQRAEELRRQAPPMEGEVEGREG